jgi:hypothetical protein
MQVIIVLDDAGQTESGEPNVGMRVAYEGGYNPDSEAHKTAEMILSWLNDDCVVDLSVIATESMAE